MNQGGRSAVVAAVVAEGDVEVAGHQDQTAQEVQVAEMAACPQGVRDHR